jgi:hypothetical protein
MQPRPTYLLIATAAFACLAAGVSVLLYMPGADPAASKRPPAIARIAEDPVVLRAPRPAAPAPADGFIGRMTGLRGQLTPLLPEFAPPPPEEAPDEIAALQPPPAESLALIPPQDAAAPDQPAAAPFAFSGAVAPVPPPRPADLAVLATAPLPPVRPNDLPRETAAETPVQTAAAPEAPALYPNAPPPPARPRELGAAPATDAAPAQSAAATIGQQLAALTSPAAPAAPPIATTLPPVQVPAPAPASEPPGPARLGMGSPAYVRIFKREGQLELWLKSAGRYTLYRTYPICKWSGHLGPKTKEADYQSPEGFYSVSARQLHPHSNYHRAFNVGYPNAFDKQNGRTGGLVMVHGACKSVGCFAMTDKGIEEIYGFVAAALAGGQHEVPVHIFPFHMTETAIAAETGTGGLMAFLAGGGGFPQHAEFWRNLKQGYDLFEQTGEPPAAFACGDHYAFGSAGGACKRVAGW